MDFIIVDEAGEIFTFPVNPAEVNISRQKGLETVHVLSDGEYDFDQGERVKEITFSSFFPKEYDASYCKYTNLPDPQTAMNRLNTYMLSKKPVRFIITETAVNVPVFVASHNTSFQGGDPGDVYFELALRTWREMKTGVKAGTAQANATNKAARSDLKKKSKTYTVKSGDTLSKIAKLELGNSADWKKIYSLNQKVIGKNPNQIRPGQKLVLS